MKPAIEWLEELIEPHRSIAIKASLHSPNNRSALVSSLAGAVNAAIYWNDSEEGYEYWADFQRDVTVNPKKYLKQLKQIVLPKYKVVRTLPLNF